MRIVFFGTSAFAAAILESLLKKAIPIVAVVTRVDKPKGRSLHLSPPPVKEFVSQHLATLPVFQPVKASTTEFEQILRDLKPDLFVVVAYGEIIKKNILDIPSLGCVNIHPSLLPKHRGAAHIQQCLLNGDIQTGVCIIEMAEAMDAGDILAEEILEIAPEEDFGSLEPKLLEIAKKLIEKVILEKENKTCQGRPQAHELATFSSKINAEKEKIDWNKEVDVIYNQIRALSPRPGAWTLVLLGEEEKRLKIFKAEITEEESFSKGDLVIPCGKGFLKVLELQLDGKKRMHAKDFLKGLNRPFVIVR